MAVVDRLARAQLGLARRGQLLDAGLSKTTIDRLVRGGSLINVHPGVYRAAGAPMSPLQCLFAAVMAAGPVAVASHSSAAWAQGLASMNGQRPHVLVPMKRHPTVT